MRFFDSYFGKFKIVSLGPIRSIEPTFQNIGHHPDERKNWPTFSAITEDGRP